MRRPLNGTPNITQVYGEPSSLYRKGYHILSRLCYNIGMELWKDIISYKGLYQISTKGRLRRLPVPGRTRNCINVSYPKGSITGKGYLVYKLYSLNGSKRIYPAHRLVAQAFIPNTKSLPQVNHKDGFKRNNSVDNLEWCTNLFNNQHAVQTGLIDNRGEKSGKAKYTESIIRKALETKGKITSEKFAIENNIPYGYVKAIRCGHRWNHIWKEYYGKTTS